MIEVAPVVLRNEYHQPLLLGNQNSIASLQVFASVSKNGLGAWPFPGLFLPLEEESLESTTPGNLHDSPRTSCSLLFNISHKNQCGIVVRGSDLDLRYPHSNPVLLQQLTGWSWSTVLTHSPYPPHRVDMRMNRRRENRWKVFWESAPATDIWWLHLGLVPAFLAPQVPLFCRRVVWWVSVAFPAQGRSWKPVKVASVISSDFWCLAAATGRFQERGAIMGVSWAEQHCLIHIPPLPPQWLGRWQWCGGHKQQPKALLMRWCPVWPSNTTFLSLLHITSLAWWVRVEIC